MMEGPRRATTGERRRRSGLRVDSRLAWQQVEDQVVLLDLSDGTVVGLNPTASHIWPLLEELDEEAIVTSVVDTFDVSPDTARADVRTFVTTCLESSYLVAAGEVEGG
jgi:hypothetical protein